MKTNCDSNSNSMNVDQSSLNKAPSGLGSQKLDVDDVGKPVQIVKRAPNSGEVIIHGWRYSADQLSVEKTAGKRTAQQIFCKYNNSNI